MRAAVLSMLVLVALALWPIASQAQAPTVNQNPATNPAAAPTSPPAATTAPVPAATSASPTVPDQKTPPKHTPERLATSQKVVADPAATGYTPPYQNDESCPLRKKGKKSGQFDVQLDWKSGSVSPSSVKHPGNYCFAMATANNVIYTYAFTINAVQTEGNPFDLLKAAITAVQDFGTGSSKATSGGGPCTLNTDDVTKAANTLQDALRQLDPGKDADGKPTSVALDTTLSKWKPVPAAFATFEGKVKDLIDQLKALPPDNGGCKDPVLGGAESIVIDGYVPAREKYIKLLALVNSDHIVRYTAELDDTNAYDVVVKEYEDGKQTTADPKTFHLNAGRAALSSSAGFLLTQLQARSYSSRTAPDPADATKTQNVLGVDFGSGVRPAIDALLNYNFPGFIWKKQFGLAVSAGPVFDIANGKADTSAFGVFGGMSLRLSQWVYLTPGVHIGQFADFPQGFTHAGQVIPPNTGTPVPNKRYTARFAFSITFKIKDLGGPNTSSSSSTPKASQPK